MSPQVAAVVAKHTKRLLSLAATGVLAFTASAHAHRMPEAYVLLESSSVNGEAITGVTVRILAEDALVIAVEAFGDSASLGQEHVQYVLLERARKALPVKAGTLKPLGMELDGEFAFLYFEGAAGAELSTARVLSSVYESWTNYVRDQRGDEATTQMFTQRGPMQDHQH
ncbi:MAG: hypothetical protein AAF830_05850 [Pseudomonadota bacterium]